MAKRLTDNNKWNDNWYSELPMDMKLVWLYILDACDHAGVYKVSFKSIRFYTETQRSEDEIINYLRDRIYISADKWFIPKFIGFQYKNFFTSKTPAIISARELLITHNIIKPNDNALPTVNKQLSNGTVTLIEPLSNDYIRTKDMDKDMYKDIDIDIDLDNVGDIVQDSDINKVLSYGVAYKMYQQLLNYELPINEYNEIYDDISEIGWDVFFNVLNLSERDTIKLDEVLSIKLK